MAYSIPQRGKIKPELNYIPGHLVAGDQLANENGKRTATYLGYRICRKRGLVIDLMVTDKIGEYNHTITLNQLKWQFPTKTN